MSIAAATAERRDRQPAAPRWSSGGTTPEQQDPGVAAFDVLSAGPASIVAATIGPVPAARGQVRLTGGGIASGRPTRLSGGKRKILSGARQRESQTVI